MNWQHLVHSVTDHQWVETTGESLQNAVSSAYEALGGAQALQNFLHGTWLGHPLHPVLTDLPIGAWILATTLDLADSLRGREDLSRGADAAVTVGLGGAVAAAAAGLTDWQRLSGHRRNVGTVHALSNTLALVFYSASALMRRSGRRTAGRRLAYAGIASVTFGAYLGGHLVFDLETGVDHLMVEPEPDTYSPVLPATELMEGQLRCVQVDGAPVTLARHDSVVYAMADTCSHLGCSLAEGHIEDGSLRCRCHGSRFSLEDGRVLDGPSTYWQPVYRVRVREGQIEVGRKELPG